jgi:hypothetical protein
VAVRAHKRSSESSNRREHRQLPTAQRSNDPTDLGSSELGERRTNTLVGTRSARLSRRCSLGSLDRWIVGSCQNAGLLTVTVNEARPSLPLVFEAQQLTTVWPIANVDPERGRQ